MQPADLRLGQWLGAPTDYTDPKVPDPMPPEPDCDGCPGGWSRCGFASSFAKYTRRRIENGGHDMNPIIGPQTPEYLLDALRSYEAFEAGAAAEMRRRTHG